MDRRSFLLGASGLAVSQMLIGCNSKKQTQLNVQLLKGSIPAQIVNQFRKSLQSEANLKFVPINQIQDIFKQLQNWQKPETKDQAGWKKYIPLIQNQKQSPADLVTLGDYWLKAAIEQKLIQPLETEKIIQKWSSLNPRWQQLVKRDDQGNIDPAGKVWAAPYGWGSTVIVYNREKFQKFDWRPKDWSDLWREELRDRISLLNHHREVIGLVLKKLGQSYNTENITQIPALKSELLALHQQVKFYDSTTYLEPLITGDTWLAVGWSNDVIPILSRYPKLTAVIPESGTAIWADLWVSPTGVEQNTLASDWINFCWQPNIAKQIVLLTKTNSPMLTNLAAADVPEPLQNLLINNQEFFNKSEFLLPLSRLENKRYQYLFNTIKNTNTDDKT
ncbi:extracellular solute-binding protein [Sphaerospermopsis aphanizomenoides BCCUSP55]|uniref:extracellular solute-binding protein n=1 Tax=Sphaerospermopsis aphanizomenoides TaxID=459663 RepID=UPI000AC4C436|nr:extracellular solute-binding protein [Sphaerospermopsis aphanizomenoides]MBK1986004.1 extracellular solute-binding protein [Sphaerospermopsis aphanizomenoides BCCUSP55]